MLKPIHIDRVQAALDILTGHCYWADEVDNLFFARYNESIVSIAVTGSEDLVEYDDENTEGNGANIVAAFQQVYGGDSADVRSISINLLTDVYSVVTATDIPIPGATSPLQTYAETRIGRVLR